MYHLLSFNENLKVNEITSFIDLSVNESADGKSIWNKILGKLKGLSPNSKNKVIKYAVFSLLTFNTVANVINIIHNSSAPDPVKEVALKSIKEKSKKEDKYKKGYEWILSKAGRDHIKEEEKLRLKAYSIGDKRITIGYGHAEPKKTSKYYIGQIITIDEAERILDKDLKIAADGVRRMFRQWEDEGVDVPITQSMFDALVSMTFNTGVKGLRNSDVITKLKSKNYNDAGKKIKKFKVSDKFPGLALRREKESEMFLASI